MSIRFPINLRWILKVKPAGKVIPSDDSGVKIAGFTVLEELNKVLLVFNDQEFFLIPSQEIINIIWSFENGSSKQYSKDELKRITGETEIKSICASLMTALNSQKQVLEQSSTENNEDSKATVMAPQDPADQHSDLPSVHNPTNDEIPAYMDDIPFFGEIS